jgi:hypothetical protein
MWTEPSIWPAQSMGLMARPTSCAAMNFDSRPFSSRMATCVAKPNVR